MEGEWAKLKVDGAGMRVYDGGRSELGMTSSGVRRKTPMALQAKHTVTIAGADKVQASALAIEFWTSKGFSAHSESYNCIVLRRNGYGSFIANLTFQVSGVKKIDFEDTPTQLTVMCQVLPQKVTLSLKFEFGIGFIEAWPGELSNDTESWCNEFTAFCNEWLKNIGE